MTFFTVLGIGLLAFFMGYFLVWQALLVTTALCVLAGVVLWIQCKEMAGLIALIFSGGAILFNAIMWTTFYLATGQTWVQDLVKSLLRSL